MSTRELHQLRGSVPATAGNSTPRLGSNSQLGDSTADLAAYLDQLVANGRFCKDTRGGGIFHRGQLSIREISRVDSLHVTLGPDGRLSSHVDRVSPLAVAKAESRCRYSAIQVVAHNAAFLASQVRRLLTRHTSRQAGKQRSLAPRWGM